MINNKKTFHVFLFIITCLCLKTALANDIQISSAHGYVDGELIDKDNPFRMYANGLQQIPVVWDILYDDNPGSDPDKVKALFRKSLYEQSNFPFSDDLDWGWMDIVLKYDYHAYQFHKEGAIFRDTKYWGYDLPLGVKSAHPKVTEDYCKGSSCHTYYLMYLSVLNPLKRDRDKAVVYKITSDLFDDIDGGTLSIAVYKSSRYLKPGSEYVEDKEKQTFKQVFFDDYSSTGYSLDSLSFLTPNPDEIKPSIIGYQIRYPQEKFSDLAFSDISNYNESSYFISGHSSYSKLNEKQKPLWDQNEWARWPVYDDFFIKPDRTNSTLRATLYRTVVLNAVYGQRFYCPFSGGYYTYNSVPLGTAERYSDYKGFNYSDYDRLQKDIKNESIESCDNVYRAPKNMFPALDVQDRGEQVIYENIIVEPTDALYVARFMSASSSIWYAYDRYYDFPGRVDSLVGFLKPLEKVSDDHPTFMKRFRDFALTGTHRNTTAASPTSIFFVYSNGMVGKVKTRSKNGVSRHFYLYDVENDRYDLADSRLRSELFSDALSLTDLNLTN